MNYCKKCVRLLDEDSNICPYCGNAEESGETKIDYVSPATNGTPVGFDEELTGLDSLIEKSKGERVAAREEEAARPMPAMDFSRSADDDYVSPRAYENSKAPRMVPDDSTMALSIRIVLILMLLFLSFVGLGIASICGVIMSIYLLKHGNRHYRSFGKLYMAISGVLLAISFILWFVLIMAMVMM